MSDTFVTIGGDTDLAYAPPFTHVWDPVHTAAKVLDGELDRA